MNGKLYLVATPIGNLEDITLRALRILKEVDTIAAEDTRHTLQLLNHFEISKPLISYYKQNEKVKSEVLINKVKEGKNIAIVSDAGTPGISDPGEEIVKRAIEENIEIVPIPGSCAAINAIIASGLSTERFTFVGFLPVNKGEKRKKIEELKNYPQTLIFYEAPHKLINTLETLKDVLGDRRISIARELTKIHEEFTRTKISEALQKYKEPKGEFVIVVEGNKEEKTDSILNEMTIEQLYNYYEIQGLDKKEIIKKIAKDKGVNKNEIYKMFI